MHSGDITIRVRYAETDRMGLLHHANYLVYFEQGRTELLRAQGVSYKDLEDQGFLLVLTRVEVKYRRPARYDDLLEVRTRLVAHSGARVSFEYEILGEGASEPLATGFTAHAAVVASGRPRRLPPEVRRLLQ